MEYKEAAIALAEFWLDNDVYSNLREFRDVIDGEKLNSINKLVEKIVEGEIKEPAPQYYVEYTDYDVAGIYGPYNDIEEAKRVCVKSMSDSIIEISGNMVTRTLDKGWKKSKIDWGEWEESSDRSTHIFQGRYNS